MATLARDFTIPKKHRATLLSSLPEGHRLIDEYWPYYVRVMSETGRSAHTLKSVAGTLRFFLLDGRLCSIESWMSGPLAQETLFDLKQQRGWSNSTYNSYRKNLVSYFQVLADGEIVPSNPIRRIRRCIEQMTDQPRFRRDQIAPLFRYVGEHQKGVPYMLYRRNHLYFLLAYYTGARPAELLRLTLDSFTENRTVLRIGSAKGKGKSRWYSLGSDVQRALTDYVRECTFAGRSHELARHLFVSHRAGKPWGYTGLREACRHLGAALGFAVRPYMFRRFVATQLFAQKLPIQDIQHHLGHVLQYSTLRYVQSHPRFTSAGMEMMSDLLNGPEKAAQVAAPNLADAVRRTMPSAAWN